MTESAVSIERKRELFHAISGSSGGMSIVANDGRESFRMILRTAGRPHDDQAISRVKRLIATELGGTSSAMLVDTVYGRAALSALVAAVPHRGRIIAVDRFIEEHLGPLTDTDLDLGAFDSFGDGAAAAKLYLHWRPEESPERRARLSRAFVDGCAQRGVLSVLEGVVHIPDPAQVAGYLVRAAAEFGAFAPDLYKTQLPTFGMGSDAEIRHISEEISEAVEVPWLVLSNGVTADRFPSAVAAACDGGASGFLAGRGVWRDAVSAEPGSGAFARARARLQQLAAIVDQHARPWHRTAAWALR
ncbi:MAG: hypothetical protein ACK5H2_12705 [Beutenbergiaceae bacterium]